MGIVHVFHLVWFLMMKKWGVYRFNASYVQMWLTFARDSKRQSYNVLLEAHLERPSNELNLLETREILSKTAPHFPILWLCMCSLFFSWKIAWKKILWLKRCVWNFRYVTLFPLLFTFYITTLLRKCTNPSSRGCKSLNPGRKCGWFWECRSRSIAISRSVVSLHMTTSPSRVAVLLVANSAMKFV